MIIGINGKAGSGKDTFAMFLKIALENNKCEVQINHFAAALKKIAKDHFYWDGEKDDKGRTLLQVIGTEAGRAYRDTIWTDKVGEKIQEGVGSVGYFLIPDTRFPNEAEFVKSFPEMLGLVIKINRPSLNTEGAAYSHSSETALDNFTFDVVIENDEDLKGLQVKAENFAKKLISNPIEFVAQAAEAAAKEANNG